MWKIPIRLVVAIFILVFLLVGCSSQIDSLDSEPTAEWPDWFWDELVNAQDGETFTIIDFSGKVVLLETMAMWCPNRLVQADEVQKLHELLAEPDDLISVSLDVDVNEDAASLKAYSENYGFNWHFAVAPLEVARALGNLYTAQYLHPPIAPMMVIDRDGNVHHLPYGSKKVEQLLEFIDPYLNP